MANDPTVKAGSWGARTVEKIIRIIELARKRELPIVYLVDSAGARITDQVELFPGRRGAGKIFYNQVQAVGPDPAGVLPVRAVGGRGRVHPGVLRRRCSWSEQNASMYLGSPRMAEEVIGEKVTLEEMGGARMHCEVSGMRRPAASPTTRRPSRRPGRTSPTSRRASREAPAAAEARPPALSRARWRGMVPEDESKAFDMYALVAALVDEASFFEIKPDWAQGGRHRARPHGRARAVGDRGQPADAQGRRAVRRLGRQGGPVRLAVRRVQHPAGVPGRRARAS